MFSATERQIFKYDNLSGNEGPAELYADPARVLRLFKDVTVGTYGQLCQDMQAKDPRVASQATQLLVNAAIYAFELPPESLFNPATGVGWMELHLIMLIDKFNGYISDLKKGSGV